ncbi:exodeoxyribonuclease V subunit gamma [Oleiagrimonas sp. MCCC 1A03011]|uniref:exodeoxyribonuclease V subunit gamma n=1 Tax=Oleiagrimonas sp. MCCC 1A03011 TaxID=1926883 RepID=UPI000DC2E015|nr:exodeoxyribonuclease V subunit gamma [Oleiagrimonas sp. MCCC 1A03011]RAP56255.1 exodeoxyribonuclease V subunit gamma [Oleiagrimonas sp. MCCC 1A03011]
MFHLHYDTHLDALADTLADLLARRDPAHLLQPQTVLVPQPGLRRWLVQRLAERYGIAANLEFIAPAQLVWRLLRAEHAELPSVSGFDREVLRWRILAHLRDPAAPAAVRAWLGEDADDLRSFELSGHLAQLYERYQGYRRELLEGWARGEDADDPQAELWRQLTRGDATSRSHLLGQFLRRHAEADAPRPAQLPSSVFAFGIINVSPDVLRVLGVLGRHCALHFFLPTPCREYWGDLPNRRECETRLEAGESLFDDPPNRLLVSLGGVGRDFVAQLFSYEHVQPDVETFPEDEDPPRDTLLQRVQADVITLSAPDPDMRRDVHDPADRSLQVHVCHSPLREVQVLHDQLLDRLKQDPELQPRDIAVMVPDLARYAPCIEAVFGALGVDDPRRIPWTVADRPLAETHALAALFLRLLDLPASRLTASEVLEVLAVPAVLRGFGLDEDVLETVRAWVRDAGVRWGEDAEDRLAHGLPAFEEYSWRFGRRRLLLGYMSGEATSGALLHGIAPLTDIEGADTAALGALFSVQRILRTLRHAQRRPQPPGAWQTLINEALDRLVPQPEGRDEERALEAARAALRALAEHSAEAAFDQPLDWRTVRAFAQEQLREQAPQQRFLAGGVSVCGLVPLRNVPFKLICVLGMDADAFPRRDPADALNRMLVGRRMPGDRSVREDDRYLFLQTLMAAERQLYLSYTGIDLRKGTAIEPSVVLSELLDHVCEGYFRDPAAARKQLVTQHPMQAFSSRLFVPDDVPMHDANVFTYRDEWLEAARPAPRRVEPVVFADDAWSAENETEAVELAALRQFFRNPAAAFLRIEAGITLSAPDEEVDEREPLTLEPLQRHRLDTVLAANVDDTAGQTLEALRAQALLPPLAWGETALRDTLQSLGPGLRQWQAWRQAHPPQAPHRFRLDLGEGRVLTGVLEELHEGGYGAWVGASHSAGGWMHWWLGALAARALEIAPDCLAWGRDSGKASWRLPWRPAMPTAAEACAHLRVLLDVHREGRREALPLPLRTAFAWAEKRAAGEDEAAACKAAQGSWAGGYNTYAEAGDAWFALAFRGRELFDGAALQGRFEALAAHVHLPLCQALRNGGAP